MRVCYESPDHGWGPTEVVPGTEDGPLFVKISTVRVKKLQKDFDHKVLRKRAKQWFYLVRFEKS